MNRRGFLGMLAGLSFLKWVKPSAVDRGLCGPECPFSHPQWAAFSKVATQTWTYRPSSVNVYFPVQETIKIDWTDMNDFTEA